MMEKKLLILAAKLLEMAAEEFDNHGCNDLDYGFFSQFKGEERKELMEVFFKYNSTEDFFSISDITPGKEKPHRYGDSTWMRTMSKVLKDQSKKI